MSEWSLKTTPGRIGTRDECRCGELPRWMILYVSDEAKRVARRLEGARSDVITFGYDALYHMFLHGKHVPIFPRWLLVQERRRWGGTAKHSQ